MRKALRALSALTILPMLFAADGKDGGSARAGLVPVLFSAVTVTDAFWSPRMETNRRVTIPYNLAKFAETGEISDKDLEAAIHVLAQYPDPALERSVAALVERIGSERRNARPPAAAGIDLGAGHFFEAAAARALISGKKDLLEISRRDVDRILEAYGPDKRRDVPEHQGIEYGLVSLYRATGEDRYWKLAKFFLDERGKAGNFFGRTLYGEYAQDHRPVVDQDRAVGHAVRATFMYTAMAEVAGIDGDPAYVRALDRLWEDVVSGKLYITGNFGPRRLFEGFGEPYELPNLTCWNETCAAYGNALWNHRLFLLHGDAKYLDVMERTIYNGFLVGVSLSGDRFFYQNPLRSAGGFERSPWFGVPCCPPNVARLLASLGGYVYATGEDGLFVNLFVGNRARVEVRGVPVAVEQQTRYPWDGAVRIALSPDAPASFAIHIRIPGWAQGRPVPGDLYRYLDPASPAVSLKVNGRPVDVRTEKGFVRLERTWSKGDVIDLSLPMPVRRVLAHENVRADRGFVALERGPVVYCAEAADNGGRVLDLLVPDGAGLRPSFRKDLLGGVGVLSGEVLVLGRGKDGASVVRERHPLIAIPYFAWANRGAGEMAVWLARDESRAKLPPTPTLASTSRVSASPNRGPAASGSTAAPGIGNLASVCDQAVPSDSSDDASGYLRLQPLDGDTAWVQYDLAKPSEVSSAEVYWLDDHRFCGLPASWRILYKDGDGWKPVAARTPYAVTRDAYDKVAFEPVRTTALRLEIRARKRTYFDGEIGPPSGDFITGGPLEWYETGLLEWKVD